MRACTISASAPARFDRLRKNFERLLRVLRVDADAAFDRDRHRDGRLHRRDAVADQRRLGHQAGAEAAVLDAVRRTAGIEIDFVKAEIGADLRAFRERPRVRAAKLQSQRMFGGIETQQSRPVAMEDRASGQHFGIEQRPARHQPMEKPAMPVSPFHHRSDGRIGGTVARGTCPNCPACRCICLLSYVRQACFRQVGSLEMVGDCRHIELGPPSSELEA